MDLVKDVLDGNRLALARLLTQIENETSEGQTALDELFPYSGKAHMIGVTGPTGSGKSTLVNHLVKALLTMRAKEKHVKAAVVAVDPSSPFTGGALLGDRVRMRAISAEPNIFVRSMASRGALGGLARTTLAVVLALDAAGYGTIVIETIGAGQAEVEIARLAHTTIVVEAPGLGDDIQAAKAGILEIADILVVNKADCPGVDTAEQALKAMLWMGYGRAEKKKKKQAGRYHWLPPLMRTVAIDGDGVQELAEEVQRHAVALRKSEEWQIRKRRRVNTFVRQLWMQELQSRWSLGENDNRFKKVIARVYNRELSPYKAVQELLPK